ncbi:MAG: TIGR04372 family glycosyltransferase [Parcubacteria group bacterium]
MKFIRLLIVPFALVFVCVVRLIKPWVLVRFGDLYTNRLGHLIGNIESYLCEMDAGLQAKAFDIWIPADRQICSKFVFGKYKSVLHVMPGWFGTMVVKVNGLFRGWEKHIVAPANNDRDIHNLWEKHAPHFGFTRREERKGQRLLRKLGVPEGAKWVCLSIRDSAYLKAKLPAADWSYHDYRDSDVATCMPAVIELISRGYYVVRVGDVVEKPFHLKHSHVIDYPFNKYKSDFGHVYLGAKCAFVLGSSSGFMTICQAFNRPVGVINYVPLEYMLTYSRGLIIWKHHIKNGRRMTFDEIVAGGFGLCTFGHVFAQNGVTLEENSAQEIYELAKEMADYAEGKTIPEDQARFWNAFPRSTCTMFGTPLHGKIVMRVGTKFLEGYQ